MSKCQELLAKASAAAHAARAIAEKVDRESRDFTDAERAEFDAKFAEAKKAKADADAARKDQEVLDQVKSLSDELGLILPQDLDTAGVAALDGGPARKGLTPLEKLVTGSTQFKALLKAYGNGPIPEKARVQSDPIPVKSLFIGGDPTSAGAFVVPEQTGIIEMLGRRPLTMRDVISVRRTGSDAVEYVRQTSHTNAAAPVPEATTAAGGSPLPAGSGVKPEGSWAFSRETATVKTIAEWVPATKRALADVAALEGLIRDELVADLKETEEDQIVAGDGTGENLQGILETSGTQGQLFDTDIFTTVRKALTKARVVGRSVPNAIALNPVDLETVDLARENGATGKFLGAGPFAMGPRTLWGVPTLEVESVPAGTGIVGDFSKAVLWDREQSTVTISDSHADFFIRNLVALLAEERVAFAVTRPPAFVIADVAA